MLEDLQDAVAELATALDVAERVSTVRPLDSLPVLAESAGRLERILRTAVNRAHLRGASWEELGAALGLPPDAIRERFYPGHKDVDRGPVDVRRPHP